MCSLDHFEKITSIVQPAVTALIYYNCRMAYGSKNNCLQERQEAIVFTRL